MRLRFALLCVAIGAALPSIGQEAAADFFDLSPAELAASAAQIAAQLPSADAASVPEISDAQIRIGFVNFRRIMATIPQLGSIREILQREFRSQLQSLNNLQSELAKLEQQLNQQSAGNLDTEALTQQLIVKRRELARQQAAFQDDYNVRRNEELAKLQSMVLEEIVGLAKAEGFDVILNDNGVLYVSERADLTQQVIERLLKRTRQHGDED